jgi:hypothetical protein
MSKGLLTGDAGARGQVTGSPASSFGILGEKAKGLLKQENWMRRKSLLKGSKLKRRLVVLIDTGTSWLHALCPSFGKSQHPDMRLSARSASGLDVQLTLSSSFPAAVVNGPSSVF